MSIEVKTARIDLRVTESEKALLEQVLDAFDNVWLKAMPGTEAFYKSVPRLHEHTCMHSWNKNSQAKVFVKSDKFAQRICDLVGAV